MEVRKCVGEVEGADNAEEERETIRRPVDKA